MSTEPQMFDEDGKPDSLANRPDVKEVVVQVSLSGAEVLLRDLHVATNGLLRAFFRMIKLEDRTAFAQGKFHKQCDVDQLSDTTTRMLIDRATQTLVAIAPMRVSDPVWRDARQMLNQYVSLLRRVRISVDSAPAIALAYHWRTCHFMLTSARSSRKRRRLGLERWRLALIEVEDLIRKAGEGRGRSA